MATGLDLLLSGASTPQNGLDVLMSATPAPPTPAAQTQPRGWLDQAGDFASAFGHHAMSGVHGLAQLVENGVAAGANLLPDNPVSRAISNTAAADNQAMKDREAKYQAATPNSPGAYAGATAGEVLPLVTGNVPGALRGVGDYAGSKLAALLGEKTAPIASRIGSGAAQGAAVSAAAPTTGDDYWSDKANQVKNGAALGGVIPPVVSGVVGGVKAAGNALRPIFAPKSVVAPLIDKMVGGNDALIEALRNPSQIVPGSKPTTAQIIATPEAVATEKALANTNPDFKMQLANRGIENNDARLAAIEGVAKTPQAIEEAVQARTDATRPMIDALLTNGKPVDAAPVVEQLKALQKSSLGTDPVVKRGVADLLSSVQEGVANTAKGDNLIRPDLLDGYRQNVRNILKQYGSNGVVASKQEAAFEPVRSAIVDSIERTNPGYRNYLETYAKTSTPINTMEAARSLLDGVGGDSRSANASGVPQVTLSKYASQLSRALKGPYNIDPEARQALEAVQSDLQRESISNSIKSPGSDTAYNLQAPGWLAKQLYGDSFTGSPSAAKVAGALMGGAGGYVTGGGFGAAGGATAGAAAFNKLGRFGQDRVNEVFARALSDPEFAAELAQLNKSKVDAPMLARLLRQVSPALGADAANVNRP